MIKNERQYRITRALAEKFERALAQWPEEAAKDTQTHPLLVKAQEEGLRSQLDTLRAQLREYETLRSAGAEPVHVEGLDELPRALIRARIAAGLTQKELARRLGLKEQQIQRYEATEYASASFRRVLEVSKALNVRLRQAS